MDVTEKGPPPDKVQWRIILARLEVLLHTIQEFGINEKAWDWRVVFEKLVAPAFFNQHPDVRLVSIEVTMAMYKIVGPELKRMIQEIENLKPNILQTITKRMEEHDASTGQKFTRPEQQQQQYPLEKVEETQEWSE